MEDTLITFETAKLAKEKGFNLTNGALDYNPVFDYIFEPEYKPTQSVLAKWLREVHNLHISINVGLPHKAPIMYYSNVIKFGKHHKSKFKSEFYKTYEEALEIGLQGALKLINNE